MPIYPRGDSFLVSVGSGKNRLRETCASQPEAQLKEKELIQQRKDNVVRVLLAAARGDSSKTIMDAYERTLKETWKDSKGVRTTKLNALCMVNLIGPDTPVTEITTALIDSVTDDLEAGGDDNEGNSGATINRKLSAFNVMMRTAQTKGWITNLPRTTRRPEAKHRVHWYNEDEEREMSQACHRLGLPDLADYIQFAIDTGFRRSELLRFPVADFQDGHLRLHTTKNEQARTIPATEPVKALIERAQHNGHTRVFQGLTEAILRHQWLQMRTYLKKEADPKYIVHVLRHTTATRLAIRGASAPQIMAYMGHKSIHTSMRYIHLAGTHLTGVAEMLTRRPVELKLVPVTPPLSQTAA